MKTIPVSQLNDIKLSQLMNFIMIDISLFRIIIDSFPYPLSSKSKHYDFIYYRMSLGNGLLGKIIKQYSPVLYNCFQVITLTAFNLVKLVEKCYNYCMRELVTKNKKSGKLKSLINYTFRKDLHFQTELNGACL